MAEEEATGVKLETWLLVGFFVAILLSTTIIIATSAGKDTVYSAYVTDEEPNLQLQQISTMRDSLGEGGNEYVVANTMSTPMLVNDWREPHRTMLIIAAPEKPFDNAEAEAIYDFVTEKGGKVIIAASSTNAQTVADKFDVKFFDAPVVDPNRFYEVADQTGVAEEPDARKLWAVAGVNSATRNHTLVRKCAINQGDTSWTNSAGTDAVNSQWIVLPQNDWTNIGSHTICICDSSTNSYTTITDTLCNGLSIVVGNNTYDSTGVYSDTLLAFNGCDSIITTNLTVLSSSISNITNNTIICDGDSIIVGSNVYNTTGSYTDTLVNTAGCDSIITTNLTVQTPTYQDISICDGDSISVGNSIYSSSGNYTDTINSSIGCDSIVYTNLTIYSQSLISGGIPNNTVGGGSYFSGTQHLELSCYTTSELVSAVIYSDDTTLTTFEIRDNNGVVLDSVTANIIPGGHRIYFNYQISTYMFEQLPEEMNNYELYIDLYEKNELTKEWFKENNEKAFLIFFQ